MTQQFSVKWSEFQSNITKTFNLLREEDYLQDVTLVTDDNDQLHANKFMLSACSTYFKEIFKNNSKHPHPLICLTGMNHEDLNSLLEYVHNGEVSILEGNLDRFLEVAKRLKIEGLFQDRIQLETKNIEIFKHDQEDQEERNSEIYCPDNLQMETGEPFDEDEEFPCKKVDIFSILDLGGSGGAAKDVDRPVVDKMLGIHNLLKAVLQTQKESSIYLSKIKFPLLIHRLIREGKYPMKNLMRSLRDHGSREKRKIREGIEHFRKFQNVPHTLCNTNTHDSVARLLKDICEMEDELEGRYRTKKIAEENLLLDD